MSKVSFITSIKCAIKGIFQGIARQRMLKVLMLLGTFAIFASFLLQISKPYFITILIAIFLMIILELFNNNFERLIDLVSPEYNREAGEIKNTMAGIVLLAFILLLIVSGLILYEPMIKLFTFVAKSSLSIIFISVNIILIITILLYRRKNHSSNINSCVNNLPLY